MFNEQEVRLYLFNYIRKKYPTINVDDREDVIQDTMVKLLQVKEFINGDPLRLASRVADNLIIDEWRYWQRRGEKVDIDSLWGVGEDRSGEIVGDLYVEDVIEKVREELPKAEHILRGIARGDLLKDSFGSMTRGAWSRQRAHVQRLMLGMERVTY